MKLPAERLYWLFVTVLAVGWVAGLVAESAPGVLSRLGALGNVAGWMADFTFPGFTTLLVPGLLLETVLESREKATLVRHATTVVYVVLTIATALWFWLSRRVSLRLRGMVMAALIVAGPLGVVASMPWAGNYFSFVFLNAITGNGYYEWQAAQDAADSGNSPPSPPAPQPPRAAAPTDR